MFERAAKVAGAGAGLVLVAACAISPIWKHEGDTVYTQRNLWVTDRQHETTNYRGDYMIPVNSKVRIGDTTERTIRVEVLDTGQRFTIVNVRKYTNRDIAAIYRRYFDSSRRDLAAFGAEARDAIRAGEIERGMSRDAVLVARGYPPVHATPTIHKDEWRYWTTGHDTRVIRFEDDRVVAIHD